MNPAAPSTDHSPRQTGGPGPALRAFGWIRSAILTLAAAVGALCIVAFVGALLAGLRPVIVISGSMEPTLPVGSVVFVRSVPADQITPGTIVTVSRPHDLGLVTHRVVSSTPQGDGSYSLVLRGDVNATEDPEPYVVTTAARYVMHVPGLGYLTMLLRSTRGLMIAASAALVLVAIYLLDPQRLRRGDDQDVPGA